jgi:EAL domain-containing protein (putative c-di-GMP-specific phosphodiesterase class I)
VLSGAPPGAVSTPAAPSDRPPRDDRLVRTGRRAPVRALRILLVPVAVGYAAAAYTPGGDATIDGDLRTGVLGGAVLLALLRAALVPRGRLAWLAGTLALAGWAVGDVTRQLPSLRPSSYPAPTDVAPLVLGPLLVVAAVLLLRGSAAGRAGVGWLDGAVAGSGTAAIAASLALATVLDAAHPAGAARFVDLARPIADLALLGVLAGALAVTWWRAGPGWLAFAAGGILLAGADLAQLALTALGRGSGADPLRPLGVAMIGAAAWLPDRPRPLRPESAAVVPMLGAAAALGLLLYGNWRPVDRPAVLLAGGCLLLAGLRAGLALRDARALAAALHRVRAAQAEAAAHDPAVDEQHDRMLGLIEDLRAAVEQGKLTLHYQPIVELRAGAVVAVEALVRWQHPTRGLLTPDAFLPLAEQSGLMRQLTVGVLDQALGQSRAWRERDLRMRIAVNLGVSTLLDGRLPYDVARLLSERGVHPSTLVFEITDDVLLADADQARQAVDRLRTLGVGTAIDDYGGGHSSLGLLRTLPVDELKLDRSLVAEVIASQRDAAIVRSAIDLAHSLGLRVTGVGVQAAAAAELLYESGCDLAQGTLICPPLPAGPLTDWLVRQGAAAAAVPPPRSTGADAHRENGDPALRA